MFEFTCYALAIVAVLWLRAERPTVATATPAPVEVAPIVDDLPSLGELMAEAEAMTAPVQPVPAVAAAIAEPVAIATVKVAELPILVVEVDPAEIDVVNFAAMTAVQLRKECQARGIRWRNVRGSKHLSKAEMLAALA